MLKKDLSLGNPQKIGGVLVVSLADPQGYPPGDSSKEAPRAPLEDLVPFTVAFWEPP